MGDHANFQVDPRLASLLGENYRSSEYALKELVDNAWDADSSEVHITLPNPLTQDPIIIEDNGAGMTEREVTKEYLVVASSRTSRKGELTTQWKRRVKGRKGIGKFAGLLAANIMSIETSARGKTTHLQISKEAILNAEIDLGSIKLPINTVHCEAKHHGTRITLSKLNQNLAFPDKDILKQLLILEYGRQADFQIFVNGELIDIQDIPGETFVEKINLPNVGLVNIRFTIITGKKRLKQSGIAIRVNGKVVGRPTYFNLENDKEIPSKLLKRIYGEIEADGLEDDVTADWGAIIENSKAFQDISKWANAYLKEKVEKTYFQDVNMQKARLQKQINAELEKIPEHKRDFARSALEKVLNRFYGESESRIRTVITVILEAFEKDEYWLVLQTIEESKRRDVETFAEALEMFGLLDLALMAQQAQHRLQVLDQLDELIQDPATLEKNMHTALEKNLWVFGSEFSLMSSEKTLARIIEDYTGRKFSGERAKKRPDLFLATSITKKKLLIEFKRPSHILTRDDENQAIKYRDDLTPDFGTMDIYVIGGKVNPKISSQYARDDIILLSYAVVISDARTELEWLIKNLTRGH